MTEMRRAAAELRERTDGRVALKFYPGGVMGDGQTVLRKMRIGQLHGSAFSSGALNTLYPDIDLYSLPLLFRDYDEVDYVRTRIDPVLREGLAEKGLVALSISDAGFAYLLSQQPIRTVDDLRGTRVWVQENDPMTRTALEIAGVAPVPLPLSDVYTGLQTGLIDTVGAPPMGAIAFQWHTKVKYFTDVPLMYLIGVFAVDAKTFAKLRPEDREALRSVVGEVTQRLDAVGRQGNREAKRALAGQGIELVTASSPEELARWRDISEQTIAALRTQGIYSDAVIEALLGHLADYRSGPQAAR